MTTQDEAENLGMGKTMIVVIMFLFVVALSGCSRQKEVDEVLRMHEQAWNACIEQGGVPNGAWFNERILAGCIFKGEK